MHRHTRRYCFDLAERLGMSVDEVLAKHDSRDLAEWMAYDLTKCEEWQKNYKRVNMTKEETTKELLKLFRVKA